MVNEQIFKGHWTEIRGRVKEKWGALTDDDLVLAEGKADQLVGIIQRRTGENTEKIEHELDQITREYGTTMEQVRQKVEAYAATASGTAHEYGERAGEAAREYADLTSEAARRQYEQLQQQYGEAAAILQAKYSEAEEAIKRNPIESLVVAFGTGLIAGVVVGLAFRPSRH